MTCQLGEALNETKCNHHLLNHLLVKTPRGSRKMCAKHPEVYEKRFTEKTGTTLLQGPLRISLKKKLINLIAHVNR